MRFKVMYYNVWHGFHSEWRQQEPHIPFVFYPKRLAAAKQAVSDESPDILVLGEACFGNPFFEKSSGKTIYLNYQKEFGFPHHEYVPKGDYEWGTALLSTFGIASAENLTTPNRTFVRAKIVSPSISLDVAHPHPDLSENEKAELLTNMVLREKECYLLVGDFNALSNEDAYNREQLIGAFTRIIGRAAYQKVPDMLRCAAIKAVRSAGLTDTFRAIHKEFNYTIPTDLLSKDKSSGIRIDYIFCSPDFKIRNAYIVKNRFTEQASDHYPVVAVLEL